MTLFDFARRSSRVRLAMRDYIEARRRGESGTAELELWKLFDADLKRAEDQVLSTFDARENDSCSGTTF